MSRPEEAGAFVQGLPAEAGGRGQVRGATRPCRAAWGQPGPSLQQPSPRHGSLVSRRRCVFNLGQQRAEWLSAAQARCWFDSGFSPGGEEGETRLILRVLRASAMGFAREDGVEPCWSLLAIP